MGGIGEPPERLFRDDGGAALERAARLEDENRRLRAELARITRAERDEVTLRRRRPDERAVVALVTGIVALVVGLTITIGVRPRPAYYQHQPLGRSPHALKVREITNPSPTPVVVGASHARDERGEHLGSRSSTIDCTTPFSYDENGRRRYKVECLGGGSLADEPKTDADDCTTPYWYSESGVRHVKKACLGRK